MGERCHRCCLHQSMRIVNLVVNLCGICMIVYSLWLQKMWDIGFAKIFLTANLPKPWFIYTCSGVGIGVCLSTLVGYMVANSITNSTLCVYIITLCSFLLLQVGVIVVIFFKTDWETQIAKYIDEDHRKFDRFINFHLKICRFVVIVAVVAQVHVVVLAFIFWAIGTEPITDRHWSMIRTNFAQSFLVPPDPSSLPDSLIECCRKCEEFGRRNRYHSFSSYLKGVFRYSRTTTNLLM